MSLACWRHDMHDQPRRINAIPEPDVATVVVACIHWVNAAERLGARVTIQNGIAQWPYPAWSEQSFAEASIILADVGLPCVKMRRLRSHLPAAAMALKGLWERMLMPGGTQTAKCVLCRQDNMKRRRGPVFMCKFCGLGYHAECKGIVFGSDNAGVATESLIEVVERSVRMEDMVLPVWWDRDSNGLCNACALIVPRFGHWVCPV